MRTRRCTGSDRLDKLLNELVSRKFHAWALSCAFLGFDWIGEETWMVVTLGFMAVVAGEKWIAKK